MEIDILLEYSERGQLRRWLEENHATAHHCWVATYRGKSAMPYALPYPAVVEEALCFGWIDSTLKRLPDGRLAQRISPRSKNSHWTETNLARVADLEQRGLMTPAGKQAAARNKHTETNTPKRTISNINPMKAKTLKATAIMLAMLFAACGNHAADTATANTTSAQLQEVQPGVTIYTVNDTLQVAALQDVANEMSRDLFVGSFDDSLLLQLMPEASTPSAINTFLVMTPKRTILFDAGLGPQAGGTLLQKLEAFGLTPADIDAVCLTHLHGDHIGGLLTDGQATFPNATLYVSSTENAACTPDGSMARMADLWAQVQKAYSGRVVTFADSVQLFDGLVQTMPAPGHTPGHTTYSVGNCLIAGDIIHAQGLQLQHPDFCAAYDNNPADAVKTRKEILKYAADNHLLFCDAHCVDQFIKL